MDMTITSHQRLPLVSTDLGLKMLSDGEPCSAGNTYKPPKEHIAPEHRIKLSGRLLCGVIYINTLVILPLMILFCQLFNLASPLQLY